MKWNQRITQAREAKKLKKVELGRLIKVSAPTITDWESGKIESLKAENLMKLCDALDITEDWLMNGEKPSSPPSLAQSMSAQCETADELRILTAYRLGDDTARRTFTIVADGVLSKAQDGGRSQAQKTR